MKRFRHISVFLILAICTVFEVYGQWDGQVSQYWRIKNYFNPSFAAESDTLQAAALYRHQWAGVDDAPRTTIVTADMPVMFLGRKHGVGLIFYNDKAGLFKTTLIGGQYVYKKRVKKNMLNVGVQLGLATIDFDASGIKIPEDLKPKYGELPAGGEGSRSLDSNLGISWIAPNYYAGVSLNHVLEPTFDIGANMKTYLGRIAYFTAGYNYKFKNPTYEFQPSVLVKADKVVIQYDITARIVYNKTFNGGISWRKDDGFVFLLGANIFGFDVGYSYDLSTSEISVNGKGSHELFLRYTLPMNFSKKVQTKHKSVRIL